jgi:phosphoribosylaminoimidazolecarboxamide formyltransferase/IMP cyclohydrolase
MPTALLSVHNKTGLIEFANGLHTLGWTLLASGGTARLLRENQLPVTEVADYTGSPEILNGRVKTLHPAIHGGLLARPTTEDAAELHALGWGYIDLVAVNLYPFEQVTARPDCSLAEAIENIDIGGVTLIRAAAKNYTRVTLLCDPIDYQPTLSALRSDSLTEEHRHTLALKGFALTTAYDRAIYSYLSGEEGLEVHGYAGQKLRYGENPHQSAALFTYTPGEGPLGGHVLQGKELSYNNLLDLDAAWRAVVSFERPSVVIVKHLSPCGIACADSLSEAYRLALASDPISAFGGIVASNRPMDEETALLIKDLFVECVIAPGFSRSALEIFAHKKNLRLLDMPNLDITPNFELRSITRGILRQSIDFGDPLNTTWQVVSQRPPTEEETRSLRFAWKACQHVKSNSIVFAVGEATVGIGGGQPNRVDCVRIAIQRAGERARGAVMASDAFFPFPDSVQVAAEAGITAIVHPGGSVRDADSIAAADAAGIAMLTTGVRHFRH